jgi:hypothetical protein
MSAIICSIIMTSINTYRTGYLLVFPLLAFLILRFPMEPYVAYTDICTDTKLKRENISLQQNNAVSKQSSYFENKICIMRKNDKVTPNTAVEWLALLLRISEVSGSNLGTKAGYPDRFFVVLLSTSRQIYDGFLPRPFQPTVHLSL